MTSNINPAEYYINVRLKSEEGKKTVASKLNQFAAVYLAIEDKGGSTIFKERPIPEVSDLYKSERMNWRELSPLYTEQVFSYLNSLKEGKSLVYSSSTLKAMLSHVKNVIKVAHERLEIYQNEKDYRKIQRIEPPTGSSKPKKNHVPLNKELQKIIKKLLRKGEMIDYRDTVLVVLMFIQGLRKSEARNITLDDVDLNEGIIDIIGKGSKYRAVHLSDEVIGLIKEWLVQRGNEPGYLVNQVRKGGHFINKDTPLSSKTVWEIVVRRTIDTIGKHVAPHDLRRAFATVNLDNGTDLATIQLLMGHADISTTTIYTKKEEERKRAARNVVKVGVIKKSS